MVCFRVPRRSPEAASPPCSSTRWYLLAHHHPRFSIRWFTLSVALQLAAFLVLFRFAAPALWSRQLAAGPGAFALVFLAMQLFLCFFEWGFHRYVLHARLHPWLTMFSRGHRNHHALTPIQMRSTDAGPGRIILNRYPITEGHQHEDSAFPWYALGAFCLLFSPLLVGAQLLIPGAPVLLGGVAAITWSLYAYEVIHAVNHYPFEWWERATGHPRWGFLWKRIYGFHHFHHANINANEAISGFFGLPIADWAFRTYNQPPDLLLHGRIATAKMFHIRSPWPFVAWLDRWSRRREARLTRAR